MVTVTNRAELIDRTRENPDLAPAEKETTIRFAKDEDRATVFTAEGGLARRLIAHSDFTITSLVVRRGEHNTHRITPENVNDDDVLVGVKGKLPLGVLSVRGSPRSTRGHAAIVTQRVLDEVEA